MREEDLASLRDQVRQNLVAIISLVLAVASLSYNTWRNEVTEDNRNVRAAGFEMLLAMGSLHEMVFVRHYDQDNVRGNPRAGWAQVLLLKDLAQIMPREVAVSAEELRVTWSAQWHQLGSDEAAIKEISAAIDVLRDVTLSALAALS